MRALGVSGYGVYAIVLAVISFGFTNGVGRVTAKYVPEYRSTGNETELSRVIAASLVVTVITGFTQAAVLAAFAGTIVDDVLQIGTPFRTEATVALYVTCAIGPAMMLGQVFQSALQGVHRFRSIAIVAMASAVLLNSGLAILALYGFSLAGLFGWNLFVAVATAGAFFLAVSRLIPRPDFTTLDSRTLHMVARYSASIAGYQIMTSVLILFERAYIARKFGTEALTYYVVPLMLGVYLHALVVAFANVVVPRLNEVLGNADRLRSLYENATKVVLTVSTIIAVGFYANGAQFLHLWLGPDFAARSYLPLVLLGAAFALLAFGVIAWFLAEAVHAPAINTATSSLTSLLAIVGIIVLGSTFSADGVAAGRLIGSTVALGAIVFVERRVFGKFLLGFWVKNFARLGLASAVVLLIAFFVQPLFSDGWFSLAALAALETVAFLLTLVLSGYLRTSEIRRIVEQH